MPSSCWLGEGENKWSSSWGLILLLLILVSVLLVSTWINIRRGHRHSGQRLSCSVVHFPSRGRARWVGGRRWRLSRRRQSSKGVSFYFPFVSFWENRPYSFFKGMVCYGCALLSMLVAKREPTPCYHDAYSVCTPNRAFRERGWQKHFETMVLPSLGRFFLVSKRNFSFFGEFFHGNYILVGPGILGLALGFSPLISCPLSLLMWVAG